MARVPYVTQGDLDPEYQEYLTYGGKTLNVHRATGNNQEDMAALDDFLEALYQHTGLSDHERELVNLTVASTIGSRYQWHNHVWLAQKLGASEEEINAIGRADRSTFPDRERVLFSYARAIAGGLIEDPLHQAVSEFFDESTVVGIATWRQDMSQSVGFWKSSVLISRPVKSSSDGLSADCYRE